MKMMLVKDAREAFAGTNLKGFAAEMGISTVDAQSVESYINHEDVPGDSFVILEETIINGVKMGAGNVCI